ncbi:hypothetical protein VTK56DRAFT_9197 [Thermocarpiscus australiensis]
MHLRYLRKYALEWPLHLHSRIRSSFDAGLLTRPSPSSKAHIGTIAGGRESSVGKNFFADSRRAPPRRRLSAASAPVSCSVRNYPPIVQTELNRRKARNTPPSAPTSGHRFSEPPAIIGEIGEIPPQLSYLLRILAAKPTALVAWLPCFTKRDARGHETKRNGDRTSEFVLLSAVWLSLWLVQWGSWQLNLLRQVYCVIARSSKTRRARFRLRRPHPQLNSNDGQD